MNHLALFGFSGARLLRWVLSAFMLFFATYGVAAISVSGSKSVTTGGATAASLSITPIAAAVRADLLVAQLTLNNATATITVPAGWTEVTGTAQSTTGIQQHVY